MTGFNPLSLISCLENISSLNSVALKFQNKNGVPTFLQELCDTQKYQNDIRYHFHVDLTESASIFAFEKNDILIGLNNFSMYHFP